MDFERTLGPWVKWVAIAALVVVLLVVAAACGLGWLLGRMGR